MKAVIDTIERIKNAFIQALPVILFFLFLFYTTIVFFGVKYVIMVSFLTVLFKVKYQKKQTLGKLLHMVFIQFSLCFLSFLATRNIYYCILLNISVPFLLVFFQSSQFNQKGYFTSAMGFVFLQLRPVGWNGLFPLMCVMAYGLSVVAIALCIYSYVNTKKANYQMARKGLLLLSKQIDVLCEDTSEVKTSKELFMLQQSMQKLTYQSRGVSYLMNGEGKIYYMFALLFQRSIYFLTTMIKEQYQVNAKECRQLHGLSSFLKVSTNFSKNDNERILAKGKHLLDEVEGEETQVSLYITNFLRLFILILQDITSIKALQPHREWNLPNNGKIFPSIKRRLKFDTFEFRFAFRLSLVLVIGFAYTKISGMNHAYWLPLNSFLLLQPMYEDSAKRLKNRFVGTCIGCLFLYFILPYFPGTSGHFIFASIMVTCMYCVVPGTWPQALFSTCFALTLAAMAMKESIAIELRLTYVCCAIGVVLLVNKFFFPTSLPGLFHDNIRRMFHLQQSYLQMLYTSLEKPLDYGIICDALTKFHLLYDQISEYLQHSQEVLDIDHYKQLLFILWQMTSEMEQMLFLTNNQKIKLMNNKVLYDYIDVCDYVLYHIQKMLKIQSEKEALAPRGKALLMRIEHEPYLSDLMEKYAKNISDLYTMVLGYIRAAHNEKG